MTTKAEHYNTITSLQILVGKLTRRRDEWKARAEKERRLHNATVNNLRNTQEQTYALQIQLARADARIADLENAVNIYAHTAPTTTPEITG
jgi:hypothetical protein